MLGSFFGTIALFASFIEGHARAVLARVLPPQLFVFIYSASRSLYLKALGGGRFGPHDGCYHKTKAMGLVFRNDLANAAGLDKDASLLEFAYRLGAGYAVVGTVLSEPHEGNVFGMLGGLWSCNAWTPLPVSGAALNSLGLPSKGVDAALANIAAFRERHGIAPQHPSSRNRGAGRNGSEDFPIGVSIMGHPAHGADAGKKLQGVLDCVRKSLPLADFIEINESCPNVDHGSGGGGGGCDHGGDDDGAHGQDEELAARLRAIVGVRDAAAAGDGRRVPLLVKLGDLGASAGATVRFLASLGVDGLVAFWMVAPNEGALRANGVGFAWMKGRQTTFDALAAFRNQPASQARALLLPLKQGANGLTLVEARHVFLLEPGSSAAVEAQAISRVNRIGQTAATTVHRYVVRGTVEEQLYYRMLEQGQQQGQGRGQRGALRAALRHC